ncbi:hypothetical protein AB0N59_00570 [Microbacterium sp. NPDC089321]|uniref:hypothetical protein n=1 Tax=Microbacterium sp. NPDC089321 TaxID=3155183 RepID=UPI003434825E
MDALLAPVVVFDKSTRSTTVYNSSGSAFSTDSSDSPVADIHGRGVLGARLVTSVTDLEPLLATESSNTMIDLWQKGARGALCAYVFRGGTTYVLPDPMGTATVLFLDADRYFVASTSMGALVDRARRLGLDLQPNLDYALEVAFNGGGSISRTSYEQVDRLHPFEYLAVSDRVERREYPIAQWFWESQVSPTELFELYLADIRESISAVANSRDDVNRIAHLTGGLDSRVVLAALLEQGAADAFGYYTVGPTGTRDRDVAEGVESTFDLAPTSFSGLVAPAFSSPVAGSVAALKRTGGMTRQGPTGYERRSDALVLGGGHGELARSFYARRAPAFSQVRYSAHEVALQLFGDSMFGPYNSSRSLLRNQARERLIEGLRTALTRIGSRAENDDYVLDFFYIDGRNRNHIGLTQLSTSDFATRVDPLYSLAGAKLAHCTPLPLRSSGLLLFDLIQRFSPKLLTLPFDSPKFGEELWHVRRQPSVAEFSGRLRPAKYPDAAARPPAIARGYQMESGMSHDEAVRVAASLNAPFWQVKIFKQAAEGVRGALAHNQSDIVEHLNHTGVNWLVKNGLKHKAYLRQVVDLYVVIEWLQQS